MGMWSGIRQYCAVLCTTPHSPMIDNEESNGDCTQADEEPLAGSKVRAGLGNINTQRRRLQGAVVTAQLFCNTVIMDQDHKT